MKPLKLTIEGLHSFKEKQAVDFDQLCDTGLFGIFGKTGSGKSTILDAITLALYGSVFRATNRTQGILNSQKDKLEVSFSFAIGFTGDRKTYRVERSFKRNKDKRDSVLAGICRLIELPKNIEKVIAEGSTEVTKKIEEIIGLNMEDFTRSAVLPQGEFSKFLQLNDGDRVRMLERLFALGDYGVKLNGKAKQERDKLEVDLRLIDGAIMEQGNVSAEIITQMQQELGQKEAEKSALLLETQLIEGKYETAHNIWQSQQELIQVRTNETQHLQAQPEIDHQKILLIKADAAEAIKPYYESSVQAGNSLAAAQNELVFTLAAYQAETVNNRSLQELFTQIDEEQRSQQPELIAQMTRLQAVQVIVNELTQKEAEKRAFLAKQMAVTQVLNAVGQQLTKAEADKNNQDTGRRNIEAEIQTLVINSETKEQVLKGVECEKDYQSLTVQANKIKAELKTEIQGKESLENALNEHEASKTALVEKLKEVQSKEELLKREKPGDIESYDVKNKRLHQLETNINAMITLMTEIQSDITDCTQLTAKQRSLDDLYQKNTGEIENCQQKIGKLEVAKDKLQAELKQFEDANLAARLAKVLAEGSPCPVCGAAHHPTLAESYDITEIESQKLELAKIVETIGEANQNRDRLNQERVRYQTNIEQSQEQLLKVQEKIALEQERLSELKEYLLPELRDQSVAQLSTYLQQEQQNLADLMKAITDWNRNYDGILNLLAGLTSGQSEIEKAMNDLKGQWGGCQKNLDRLNGQWREIETNLGEKQKQYRAWQSELNIADFQGELIRIQANERKIEALRKTAANISTELVTLEQLINEAKQQKESQGLQLKAIDTSLAGLDAEIIERRGKIRAVAGERRPQDLMGEIEAALSNLAQKFQAAKKRYEVSTELLKIDTNQKTAAQKKVDLFKNEAEVSGKIFTQKMLEKGFGDDHEFKFALKTEPERSNLKNTISTYEDLSKHFQSQVETLLKRLAGQSISAAEWEQVQSAKREITERKESVGEAIAKISTTLQEMNHRWQKVKDYQQQRQNVATRKSMADEICKLLMGDAFVAYIAEEHLRYIVKDASGRLETLTNSRYILKMDDNKDFMICDNTNGGLARPVSSLSGGETFLVSLSLALALSSKIQLNGRNPLEFFFLDEGFGTLDSQLLETVMDSLEKLRQGNLTIGVISHVPELRNRICRRLIVTPASVNGDGSRVCIEKG